MLTAHGKNRMLDGTRFLLNMSPVEKVCTPAWTVVSRPGTQMITWTQTKLKRKVWRPVYENKETPLRTLRTGLLALLLGTRFATNGAPGIATNGAIGRYERGFAPDMSFSVASPDSGDTSGMAPWLWGHLTSCGSHWMLVVQRGLRPAWWMPRSRSKIGSDHTARS